MPRLRPRENVRVRLSSRLTFNTVQALEQALHLSAWIVGGESTGRQLPVSASDALELRTALRPFRLSAPRAAGAVPPNLCGGPGVGRPYPSGPLSETVLTFSFAAEVEYTTTSR